jgi:hypothetical protein
VKLTRRFGTVAYVDMACLKIDIGIVSGFPLIVIEDRSAWCTCIPEWIRIQRICWTASIEEILDPREDI